MSRIILPENLSIKELQAYLVKNKSELITKKKSLPIKSDVLSMAPELVVTVGGVLTTKKAGEAGNTEPLSDVLRVKVVGNTALWCDSGMDVLGEDAYTETVAAKGANIPHIKNHAWDDCAAHVGDVVNVYTQKMYLKQLGLDKAGRTTVVCWETDIRKDYDEKVHRMYGNGKIKQHSIGLQYLELMLAVNNKEYAKEYETYKKWIDKIINKEIPEERGYFWFSNKIRLIENSCVLFGMNELTPTTSVTELSQQEPATTTAEVPKAKKRLFLITKH